MEGASETWIARILAVGGVELRVHQLASDLSRIEPQVAVGMLCDIQEEAARGGAPAASFMVSLQEVLTSQRLPYKEVVALYKAAAQLDLVSVQRLILAPPAAMAHSPRTAQRAPDGADTLGMRTWRARTGAPADIDRLLRDPDPRVVRNLLQNPRLTEKQVLRLVTRRPIQSVVLEEVALSGRWNRRTAVRRALVFNPYTPTHIALRMLPLLSRGDLQALASNGWVHEEVARQAEAFLPLRPPLSGAARIAR
jgi:hypothetical protein